MVLRWCPYKEETVDISLCNKCPLKDICYPVVHITSETYTYNTAHTTTNINVRNTATYIDP